VEDPPDPQRHLVGRAKFCQELVAYFNPDTATFPEPPVDAATDIWTVSNSVATPKGHPHSTGQKGPWSMWIVTIEVIRTVEREERAGAE
jgi:hypothetical protein